MINTNFDDECLNSCIEFETPEETSQRLEIERHSRLLESIDEDDPFFSRAPSKYLNVYSFGKAFSRYSFKEGLNQESFQQYLSQYGELKDGYFQFSDGGKAYPVFDNENGDLIDLTFSDGGERSFALAVSSPEITSLIFRENPYYEYELRVERLQDVPNQDFPLTNQSDCKTTNQDDVDILIIPDIHGEWDRINYLSNLIKQNKHDWIGLEMLPHTMRETIVNFLNQDQNSSSYEEARRHILEYFSSYWNDKFPNINNPEDNPYFKILELAQKHNVDVYPLDASIEYEEVMSSRLTLSSHISVRNIIWSKSIPPKESGKGAIFGGADHFNPNRAHSVQFFLKSEYPGLRMSEVSFSSNGHCPEEAINILNKANIELNETLSFPIPCPTKTL